MYKETRLIDISYTHTDPEVAAKVVNAIAETYVFNNLERKTESNTNTGDVLQKRIAELQQTIRADEERLVNYAKNNQILSLDASQNTVVERLGALNKQLGEAENQRIEAESRFNAAKDPSRPGAAAALTEADQLKANESETKLAELRQKRAQLMVDATEEAPEVREVDTQIAELDRQVKEIRNRKSSTLLTNLETNYRQSLSRASRPCESRFNNSAAKRLRKTKRRSTTGSFNRKFKPTRLCSTTCSSVPKRTM